MIVAFKKDFEKQRDKLSRKIISRFDERLTLFLQNKFDPILENHSVHPIYADCRSINVTGDYRAIFYEVGSIATFIAIGTHSQLYK